MWAAASLFTKINSWRPNGDMTRTHRTGGFLGFGSQVVEEKSDVWQWTADFRAGKGRPEWMTQVVPSLEAMTRAAEGPETRLDAALALLPLGPIERPIEVIEGAVRAEPRLATKAAQALP